METIRHTLLLLHVLLAIFGIVNLHPHLKFMNPNSMDRNHLSASIAYASSSIRIILYHSACIAAVCLGRRYGVWMVRGTGVFLIGELLQAITTVVQQALGTDHMKNGELFFIVVYDLVLLTALLVTFRLVEKLFKLEQLSMQRELLVGDGNSTLIDNSIEPDLL